MLKNEQCTGAHLGHPCTQQYRQASTKLYGSTSTYTTLAPFHAYGVWRATEGPRYQTGRRQFTNLHGSTLKKAPRNQVESRSFLIIWDIRTWLLLRVSTGEVRVLCFVALNIILNIFLYFPLILFCFRLEFQFYSRLVNRSQYYIIGRLSIWYCEVLAVMYQLWSSFWSVSSREAFLYINMTNIKL